MTRSRWTPAPAVPCLVLALVLALVMGAVLTGCGREDDADPVAAGSSPSATSTPPEAPPTSSAAPTATAVPDAVAVDVDALPAGPPPRVDVLVDGTLLLHAGREITPERYLSRPLGSFDGRTYAVGVADGVDQVVTVADDGTVTALGRPHPTYNHFPQLVRETGHVLMVMQNRNGPGVLWVVDARTGEDVAQVRGRDFSALEPADRALAELWSGSGSVDRPQGVLTRSADGRHEVAVADPYAARVVLTLRHTSGGAGTSFRFRPTRSGEPRVLVEQVVVESPTSFLAVAVTGRSGDAGSTYVVVRCRAAGTCERVGPTGTDLQVAGSGTDTVLAEPS